MVVTVQGKLCESRAKRSEWLGLLASDGKVMYNAKYEVDMLKMICESTLVRGAIAGLMVSESFGANFQLFYCRRSV